MSTRAATAWIALFAVLVVAALFLVDEPGPGGSSGHRTPAGELMPGTSDESADQARSTVGGRRDRRAGILVVKVVHVVDGDTIVVRSERGDDRVRYIGVDTPESVKPGVPIECFAKAAASFNRRLVLGRVVTLRFDRERRDRYGRLLAYVEVADRSVNATLLRRGYARTLEIAPNTRHATQYRRLADRAQARGRGLWGACR